MNWASDVDIYHPNLNQVYVKKESISDDNAFKNLIEIYHLHIFSEEKEYYILEGCDEDLNDFNRYWSVS